MRGTWFRPWAKHRYHLFVVLEDAGSLTAGIQTARGACLPLRRLRLTGPAAKFTDDPAPPTDRPFPNCTGCVKAYKASRSR